MLSLDCRCIARYLFVPFTTFLLVMPDVQASAATKDDPSVPMLELAQVLECTAKDEVKDRITNGIGALINHRLRELPDAATYAQWKVTGLSMGHAFLVALPGEVRVFGHSSDQLLVTSEGLFAVLDGKTLSAVTDALGLQRRDATHAAITADWRRLVWRASRPGEDWRWSAVGELGKLVFLPTPVMIAGNAINALYGKSGSFYVIHDGTTAASVARNLGIPPAASMDGGKRFRYEMPKVIADDGWQEGKTLSVFDLPQGRVFQGCDYAETVPDWGPELHAPGNGT
ncbi:hypothetical protein K7567_16770 [Stenotrophomonas maltophilia]|nr:hypothetical protein K7567_16770 [Stenotrophomonas maltophilia]